MRPGAVKPSWPHPFRMVLLLLLLLPSVAQAQQVAIDAMLQEANDLKDGDACDGAVPLYDEVIARAEIGTPAWGWALYNRGVCHEELGDPQSAAATYTALIDDGTDAALVSDARFRRGLLVIVHGGDTSAARTDFRAAARGRRGVDRAILDIQFGRLDLDAGRPRAAARRAATAARVLDAEREENPDRRGGRFDWFGAQVALLQGDIWLDAAARVSLRLKGPVRVTKRITRRAEYLGNAETFYVRAIGLGCAPWSQEALLQLGNGYRAAAEALAALLDEARTSPGGPSEAERLALAHWLEPRVDAQLRKAADAWVLCLQVESEIGGAPDRAEACQAGVDELVERLRAE